MLGQGRCGGARQLEKWMGLRWVCLLQIHAPEAGSSRFPVSTQHERVGLVVDVERVFVDDRVAVGTAEFAETE